MSDSQSRQGLAAAERIRVVLVETSHPGNIGAAARAMKVMGLGALHLVKPWHFPSDEASDRASGADDILAKATVHEDLASAVADCHLVLGTSARLRSIQWEQLDPRQAGERLVEATGAGQVAVVFGREKSGLSNEELDLCTHLVHIPANPEYSSLNLGAAVQVLAYELRMAMLASKVPVQEPDFPPASHEDMERLYHHLRNVLARRDFLKRHNPEHLMRRFRALFGRAGLDTNEVQILRGMLRAFAPEVDPKGPLPEVDKSLFEKASHGDEQE
ncbi:MAG: RNA methyltransferase [Gammaproteobacteria bacterium]|nr:RNA methyltransferase [Gammaproteobacteria bacterium]